MGQSITLALVAHESLDPIIEPQAATVVSIMSSGALQTAASRLWTFSPAGISDTECRRAALSMLMRSIQILPGNSSSCSAQLSAHIQTLSAHAHILQSEVHADSRGRSAGEKAQQRQQRIHWHLERASTALHAVGDGENREAMLLLMHLRLLRAKLLLGHGAASKRLFEEALEELIAGCRAAAAKSNAKQNDEAQLRRSLECCESAWDEALMLLLQQVRAVL